LMSEEKMEQPLVGVVMGSASDLEKVQPVFQTLEAFQVPYEAAVVSAHRTPHLVSQYAESAAKRGIKVIIAAAGLAAALPGALAAVTDLPVIGLPLSGGPANGMDALLSMADMPPGIPVATVGVDSAKNAALLAVRILGQNDGELSSALARARARASSEVIEKTELLRNKGFPMWDPKGVDKGE